MPHFLYLMRHGHIETAGCLVGQADCPLSPQGILQAENWRKQLAPIGFSAVWCSPLTRAVQTASLLVSGRDGLPVQTVDALKEVSLGLWEGQKKTSVMSQYPKEWAARGQDMYRVAPPEGESLAQLAKRVLPAFSSICGMALAHENTLLVAHRSVCQAILAHTMALPAEMMPAIHLPYAALVRLDVE